MWDMSMHTIFVLRRETETEAKRESCSVTRAPGPPTPAAVWAGHNTRPSRVFWQVVPGMSRVLCSTHTVTLLKQWLEVCNKRVGKGRQVLPKLFDQASWRVTSSLETLGLILLIAYDTTADLCQVSGGWGWIPNLSLLPIRRLDAGDPALQKPDILFSPHWPGTGSPFALSLFGSQRSVRNFSSGMGTSFLAWSQSTTFKVLCVPRPGLTSLKSSMQTGSLISSILSCLQRAAWHDSLLPRRRVDQGRELVKARLLHGQNPSTSSTFWAQISRRVLGSRIPRAVSSCPPFTELCVSRESPT